MKYIIKYLLAVYLIGAGFSCREKYKPDIISSSRSVLVVEGVLNINGPTTVRITRTTKLDSIGIKPELNAQVTVEGRDNTIRTLTAGGGGNYSSFNLNLVLNNEYRLRIRTAGGKEYLSEYVTAKQTPPIDSIGWRLEGDNVRLSVNAHDASGNTRYYRWDYDETWEINARYYSWYIYVKNANTVRPRNLPAEEVFRGWKYNSSKNILLASSARLQSDIISAAPLFAIARGEERIAVRYSILLRQYAMDKKGYDFYDLMKRNTENLGTIFDAQPSEVKGNIQCVNDPAELVIGYVSASTISEKRIFISATQLPNDWRYIEDCPQFPVANHPDSFRLAYQNGSQAPYDAIYSPTNGQLIGYLSSYTECVDCTARGGSLIRPFYW
jgi:Domain of unknown function (DUF4249)